MEISEIIALLGMEVDKQLFNLQNPQLRDILSRMSASKDKKTLITLLSDEKYFTIDDLVKTLEKKDKKMLSKILNEPEKELEMRNPLNLWMRDNYVVEYELPYPKGGRNRFIDVVGFKKGGFLTSDVLTTIELKAAISRSAIDSAFSQAQDYQKCSDYTYVAFSPYTFLKQANVIMDKLEDNKDIGGLLVDKSRVLSILQEPKTNDYNDDLRELILKHFK